jgi:hypothetical protein
LIFVFAVSVVHALFAGTAGTAGIECFGFVAGRKTRGSPPMIASQQQTE